MRDLSRRTAFAGVFASMVALGMAAGACAGERGELVLALQTDMALPKDIDRVRIRVLVDGAQKYGRTFWVDPDHPGRVKIPATLAIAAGDEENQAVEIQVIAFRGDEARTLNKTITTIPRDRVAMMRVPIQWLCDGMVIQSPDPGDEDGAETKCKFDREGRETACVAGSCVPVLKDGASLPTFEESQVFGGAAEGSRQGVCFPTEDCFEAGSAIVPVMADPDDDDYCTVSLDAASRDVVNFAIKTPNEEAGGICRGSNCFVPLDQSAEFGWQEVSARATSGGGEAGASGEGDATAARKFRLPKGVCDKMANDGTLALVASTDRACAVTKSPKYPTCGPWSGVGQPSDGPNEPPPEYPELEQMYRDFFLALCEAPANCEVLGSDPVPIDPADCERWVDWLFTTGTFDEPSVLALEDAIEAGRVVVNHDTWDACVDRLRACEDLFNLNCDVVITGTLSVGDACIIHEECEDGYCSSTAEAVCPGRCRARVADGGACSTSTQCEELSGSRSSCEYGDGTTGSCTVADEVVANRGQDCEPFNVICASGLTCEYDPNNGRYTCEPLPGQDDPCTNDCAAGLYCAMAPLDIEGTCQPLLGEGDDCDSAETCASGFACACSGGAECPPDENGLLAGTCRASAVVGEGEDCGGTQFCDIGLLCHQGTCQVADGTEGSPCQGNFLFASCRQGLYCGAEQTCEPRLAGGRPCDSDYQCESDQCVFGEGTTGTCADEYCEVIVPTTGTGGTGSMVGVGGAAGMGQGGAGGSGTCVPIRTAGCDGCCGDVPEGPDCYCDVQNDECVTGCPPPGTGGAGGMGGSAGSGTAGTIGTGARGGAGGGSAGSGIGGTAQGSGGASAGTGGTGGGPQGPCNFGPPTVMDTMNCSDSAVLEGGSGVTYNLICAGGTCGCYEDGVLIRNPNISACFSVSALRGIMIEQCVPFGACGGGCPPTAPQGGDSCEDTAVYECAYNGGTFCYCDAGMYYCTGG